MHVSNAILMSEVSKKKIMSFLGGGGGHNAKLANIRFGKFSNVNSSLKNRVMYQISGNVNEIN